MTARSSASSAISLSGSGAGIPGNPLICAYPDRKTGTHFCGIRALVADALDRRTAAREFFLKAFETAVQMIDTVDHGFALGGKSRDDQRHRGAQVGRHHGRAAQCGGTVDGRDLAIEGYTRAEPRQFLHMHKAVLENRLRDPRGTAG